MHSGETAQRLMKLPLVLGMPVIVSQNFDVNGGVVNGSIGILHSVRYTVDGASGKRHLRSCVVRLKDTVGEALYGLEKGDYPIMEDNV
ncbi:hypothetical protein GY45DRAFT_1232398, partial [Cubamyces sp. BRFM 1775]